MIKDLLIICTHCFWHFVAGFAFFYVFCFFAVNGLIKFMKVIFRAVNIGIRGWPPAHVDADGDSIAEILEKLKQEA